MLIKAKEKLNFQPFVEQQFASNLQVNVMLTLKLSEAWFIIITESITPCHTQQCYEIHKMLL